MDRENFENPIDICPPGHPTRIRLFMEFAADRSEEEVPDPYFGGPSGLLEDIRRTRRL